MSNFHTIYIHTRPQVDTVIAVFLLRTFGKDKYPGLEASSIQILPIAEKSEEEYEKEGCVLVDVGGGKFDHHGKDTTATELIARNLDVFGKKELQKLLTIADRDDKYGKGIISKDRIDRAFGLPGLLMSLNKSHPDDPERVIETFLPVIQGHYEEEVRREVLMPREYEELKESGKVEDISLIHKGKKLLFVAVETDNVSMPGWLRAFKRADVVAVRNSMGHVAVLTKGNYVDLRNSVVEIRRAEIEISGADSFLPKQILMQEGRLEISPEWYYDPKTNTILNGGIHAQEVAPSKIPWESLIVCIEKGLEQ